MKKFLPYGKTVLSTVVAIVVLSILIRALVGNWEAPLFLEWLQTATTSEVMFWAVITLWIAIPSK